MKHYQQGQGLVEYALVLVLVVIAFLLLIAVLPGEEDKCAGNVTVVLVSPAPGELAPKPLYRQCAPPESPLVMNYFARGRNYLFDRTSLKVISPPECPADITDCGTVVVNTDENGVILGSLTYTPGPDTNYYGVRIDFELCLPPPSDDSCGSAIQYVHVGPNYLPQSSSVAAENIVASVDATASDTTAVTNGAGSDTAETNWVDIYWQSRDFLTQAAQLEFGAAGTMSVSYDAVDAAMAILVQYAIASGDTALQAGLSAASQAFEDRDEEAFISALTAIGAEIALVPDNLKGEVLIEVTPRIIDAYHFLYGAAVPNNAIDLPLQVLLDQEAANPGSTYDAIPRLLERWDNIQQLNLVAETIGPALGEGVPFAIGIMEASGNEAYIELAQQFKTDFFWGLPNEAIKKALVDPEGIRSSLLAKLKAAEIAYGSGDLVESGNALSDLLNQLEAMKSKHMNPDSATLIRDAVNELAEGLEIPLPPGE